MNADAIVEQFRRMVGELNEMEKSDLGYAGIDVYTADYKHLSTADKARYIQAVCAGKNIAAILAEGRTRRDAEHEAEQTAKRTRKARSIAEGITRREQEHAANLAEEAEIERQAAEEDRAALVSDVAAEIAKRQPVQKSNETQVAALAGVVGHLMDTVTAMVQRMTAPRKTRKDVVRNAAGDIVEVIEREL